MVIPYTTQNQKAAEAWINYIYDRANYAKLVAFTQYVPVLSDMTDELEQDRSRAGEQPADQPAAGDAGQGRRAGRALTDEQTQEFNTAYAAVTGA